MPKAFINKYLIPFWISFPQDDNFPVGLGVTAFSIEDAYSILEELGIDEHLRAKEVHIIEHVKWDDISARYFTNSIINKIGPNAGPMVVRGVWFPNFNASGFS